MPVYDNVSVTHYYPNPELYVRKLHLHLGIESILDVGTGHGGVFDLAYWDGRSMKRKTACDLFKVRATEGNWEIHDGVDARKLVERYGEKSFDMVQCMEALEHIPDNRIALEQMLLVARKLVVITSADEGQHRGPEQAAIELINPAQAYLKQPSIEDLTELGFETFVEHFDRRQIIAWKYL